MPGVTLHAADLTLHTFTRRLYYVVRTILLWSWCGPSMSLSLALEGGLTYAGDKYCNCH